MLRAAASFAALPLVAVALTSCASEPEPEWTEEEAYAAAEETFRGYWGLELGATIEQRLPFVTGEMADEEQDSEGELADRGVEIRGESVIRSFDAAEFRTVGETTVVSATACIDGSDVEVNVDGQGWRQPREEPHYAVVIDFESVGEEMLISGLVDDSDISC